MKSGLGILIRAPKMPFSVPPKWPSAPDLCANVPKIVTFFGIFWHYFHCCLIFFWFASAQDPCDLGTLFFRSSYHYLLKIIAHFRHICNFDGSCICVFGRVKNIKKVDINHGPFIASILLSCH